MVENSERQESRRSRWMIFTVASALAIAALVVVLITPSSSGDSEPNRQRSSLFSRTLADFDPVEGTGGLMAKLQNAQVGTAVVRGEVVDYSPGRLYVTAPGLPSPTVVMKVKVNDLLSGQLPSGSNGAVYVELDGPAPDKTNLAIAATRKSVPAGTPMLLYLWKLPPQGFIPDVEQVNPEAGRPAGQPLYRAFVQGLYVQEGDTVLAPQEHLKYPGHSLEDFEPGAGKFPSDGEPTAPR